MPDGLLEELEINSLAEGEEVRFAPPLYKDSTCNFEDTATSQVIYILVSDPVVIEDLWLNSLPGFNLEGDELVLHPYDIQDILLESAGTIKTMLVVPYYLNLSIGTQKTDRILSLSPLKIQLADKATLEASLGIVPPETDEESDESTVTTETDSDTETKSIFAVYEEAQ